MLQRRYVSSDRSGVLEPFETSAFLRRLSCFLSCFSSHRTGMPKLGPQIPAAFICLASLVLASLRSCFASLISFHLSVGHGFAVLMLMASVVRYSRGPASRALVRSYSSRVGTSVIKVRQQVSG